MAKDNGRLGSIAPTSNDRFARGTIEIFSDAIQNAVHESTGFGAAKSLCELDRFVDRNDRRNVVAIKHFVDGEPQDIAIDRGNAVEIVILAITFDLLVNFRKVRNHPFDEWLGEFAHVRFDRTKFPKVTHVFGGFAVLEVAPEVILNGRFARASPFAHTLFVPQLRDHIRNLDRSTRRFSAAIDFIFETPLARRTFVVETQDDIDDGDAMSNRDSLERVGH